MKRLLAIIVCVWLLAVVIGTAPVQAATEPEGGETSATDANPTDGEEDPTTTVDPENTTAAPADELATTMSLRYADGVLTVRVIDQNGEPVRKASILIETGSRKQYVETNKQGIATLEFDEEPTSVVCSMRAQRSGGVMYAGCQASKVLQTTTSAAPSTTVTEPTEPDKPTDTTSARQETSTRVRTTTPSLTTTDPSDVEVTEIVTVTAAITTQPTKAERVRSHMPRGMALWLMIGGVVLLLGAAAVAYFFLIRAPRVGKEEGSDTPSADEADGDFSAAAEETAESVGKTDDAAEEPKGTVSLEDLFRDL